jgi:hypothetical protein
MPPSSASRAERPQHVFVCSGHMIDAPGRREARFPASKEAPVRRRISAQLSDWSAGERDVGICGGACGADILFAEACLARGARVTLLIPLPEEAFLEKSVSFADADWEERYRALRARCETRFQHEALGPPANGENVFERNNLWCLEVARSLVPPERIHALLVWDEKPGGDGPGGTSDFAARVERAGGSVSVINPTRA